jgi:hypothetical protein
MKKALILFLLTLFFAACKNNTPNTTATTNNDSATMPASPFPYTAVYSSNFVPGKQSDVLTVLNNYKAWESNDMKAMKATLGDTVMMYFTSGTHFTLQVDSAMSMASKFRDSLTHVALTIYVWTSHHSVDRNEDWVNVWYKEVDQYKTGKIDSAYYADNNMLKDGKIVMTSSYSQKIKK